LNFELVYKQLFTWCAADDFGGYDPFDGLNSRFFQATPLKNFALARLLWIQTVKRSPVNLRPLLQVPAGNNSKGIALFALAELSRYRATQNPSHEENIRSLLNKLNALKIQFPKTKNQKPKTAYSYNFDWQSRAFFAPRGTPTIVPTAFAARAFFEAHEIFGDHIYLETAREICDFIISDLNHSFESADEICFSYTPLDKSVIFNASLLAGETLGFVGAIENNFEWLELAAKTARFVLRGQNERGAWEYGTKLRHQWVDNFHTAFILSSLWRMKRFLPGLNGEIELAVERGYDFWTKNLFLSDGAAKYYDSQTFPVDIHSAAAAIVALCDVGELNSDALKLADKIAVWTITNLRDESGFFYYQKRRFYTVKTPFIRWAQAWMAFAISRLLECKIKN
jgi:hypothetical protein